MLDELPKSKKRNEHIKESNIIVSTPIFDNIVCSMRTKKFKEKELQKQREAEKEAKAQKKGVGCGAGKIQEERTPAPSGGKG